MNLRKLIFTQNDCYKSGRIITPKGIMVHSTGANNPWLKRYIGPDDGLLGYNQNGNHWNTAKPGGREVCVHGFIGKLADSSIATYQTLPWNMRGWHSGSGKNGAAHNTHIGFEICEDGLTDSVYFAKVYREAVELCAYLCQQFNLDPMKDGVLICHSEGFQRGIASNHGDVMHWFPRHGKSMDTFRRDVAALLAAPAPQPAALNNKQEDDTMTPDQFATRMKEWEAKNNPTYNSLSDVPDYWQAETKSLLDIGAIQGDGVHELGIKRETLKAAIVAVRVVKKS